MLGLELELVLGVRDTYYGFPNIQVASIYKHHMLRYQLFSFCSS